MATFDKTGTNDQLTGAGGMSLTRRQFTASLGCALGAGSWVGHAASLRAETAPFTLVASEGMAQLAPPGYPSTPVWGFDGRVPGPTIRLGQNQRLLRRFVNRLPQPSSIHWHGIRIENMMDGAAGLTQAAVSPGDDFVYDFAVPDAGTFWYHSHNRSWEQMARGLYGALIVEEPADAAPQVDQDELLLIDDWRLTDAARIASSFGNAHDRSHAGRIGNWITVNGDGAWSRTAKRHSRLRLRLANTANARILTLDVRGLAGWVVALDGMPLDKPVPLARLVLAPAQRADLIVDVVADEGKEALLLSRERDGAYPAASLVVDGLARPQRLPPPGPLPANPVPELGALDAAQTVHLVMEGGAMGDLRSALMGGRTVGLREMAEAGKFWAFNGLVGMPAEPLFEAERGEPVRIMLHNNTAWPHAMHLHGHHFRHLVDDGVPGPLRDTLLVDGRKTAEIALVADNPGDWLLHCHMLEHSAGGMRTWFRVV